MAGHFFKNWSHRVVLRDPRVPVLGVMGWGMVISMGSKDPLLRGVSLAGAGYMAGMGDLWVPHRIWPKSWIFAVFWVFRGFPQFLGF